jgi:hypothetical protein
MNTLFIRRFGRKKFLSRIAVILSFVYLFTNVAFAHLPAKSQLDSRSNNRQAGLPQTSVWKERKENVQLASIAGLSPLPALQNQLINQTPGIRSAFSNRTITTPVAKEKFKSRAVAALPDSFFAHVNIKNVFQTNSASTIVLLEDVHMHAEAQTQISEAIRSFARPTGTVLIALEGAAGDFVFDSFKKFDSQAVIDVADSFLETKDISGPAHAGFISAANKTSNLLFWGVDDKQAYPENIRAYKEASKIKPAVLKQIAAIKKELAEGRPVITFHYGYDLKNPLIPFRVGGSYYHVMILKGYDENTEEFIVQDSGNEKSGENFRYSSSTIMTSLRDYNRKTKKASGSPVVLFTMLKQLVHAPGDPRLYLIRDNKKYYIDSMDVFTNHNWARGIIKTMAAEKLEAMPLSGTIKK